MTEQSALKIIIQEKLKRDGWISLADYMALCLGHERYGYYIRQDPFGLRGDFTTAPEISQLFGEIIGIWLIDAMKYLHQPFQLIELGPGRGTLMHDVLRVLTRLQEEPFSVSLVEMSPHLKTCQKDVLKDYHDHPLIQSIQWYDYIENIEADKPWIVIANEFFDALPIRQYIKTAKGWHERGIGLRGDQLIFAAHHSMIASEFIASKFQDAPIDSVIEVSPAQEAAMHVLAQGIKATQGLGLFIDYGYKEPQLVSSFQALEDHAYVDPLARPGCADLTAHINFSALIEAGKKAGAHIINYETQGDFLLRHGLLERAGLLGSGKSQEVQYAISRAVERLAGDCHMGELFKVLAISAEMKSE
jgi:SAM-dependent MidA family methyltransferase